MLYDIEKIGNRIRQLRKDQGMTQSQLAAKLRSIRIGWNM